jgi:Chaperone of endosialidase
MKNPIRIRNATDPITTSLNRSLWRRGLLLIPLVFTVACLALSPPARAACQEGCDFSTSNTFLGDDTLNSNTTGALNTAIGYNALFSNTTGTTNTADGSSALFSNTTGFQNTANGYTALYSNTTGNANTANGESALGSNTNGSDNTASGIDALVGNTTGNNNTADGERALVNNTTGSSNIALGVSAGQNLTTGSNNIDLAAIGVAGESNTMRLGKKGVQKTTYIAGISGVTVAGGVGVIIDTSGHLGTIVSSERYKDAIQPMDRRSEAILALKPVTFHYKKALDPDSIPQFGLVAEQVEKVNPDLVARDEHGKPSTVRYEAVNAMLLNEFLKEHRKVERQEATIAQQQTEIRALESQMQKVSNELELIKPAPRVVANR